MSVTIKAFPNEPYREYWTRVEVCDALERTERGTGRPDSPVLGFILDIPGVQEVRGAGYRVGVVKAESFTWAEIEPEILAILNALGQTRSDVPR